VDQPAPHAPGWPASSDAVAHVFVDDLTDECTVGGEDGHHLQRARRLHPGEHVTAADGSGRWRCYNIVGVTTGQLHLAAIEPPRAAPEVRPSVAVAVALTKGRGLDDVVAALTELGVARIEPVRTERSVVRWDDARAAAAVARWRTIAREAAMQSRRVTIPAIAPVASVEALAGRPGLVVADYSGMAPARLPAPPESGWLVLVGPEGGLAPGELDAVGPVPRVAIGRFVLRSQTAPLAVVAALVAGSTGVPDVVN
jgi:16S rRNA (uracil1498-N3)-methyltransferase